MSKEAMITHPRPIEHATTPILVDLPLRELRLDRGPVNEFKKLVANHELKHTKLQKGDPDSIVKDLTHTNDVAERNSILKDERRMPRGRGRGRCRCHEDKVCLRHPGKTRKELFRPALPSSGTLFERIKLNPRS